MNKMILIGFSFGMLCVSYTSAVAGRWSRWEAFCHYANATHGVSMDCSEGPTYVQNAVLPNWAGEVVQLYGEEGPGIIKMLIKITWKTDRSDYRCGAKIKVDPSAVKSFSHRSIKMKQCHE